MMLMMPNGVTWIGFCKKLLILTVSLLLVAVSLSFAAESYDRGMAEKFNQAAKDCRNNMDCQITAAVVAGWMKDGKTDFQIVDVRDGEGSAESYKKGHIPGAIHIPYSKIFEVDQIAKLDKNKVIIVVCNMGATEELPLVSLRVLGFNVKAMLMGMAGWQKDYPAQGFVKGLMDTANTSDFPLEAGK